MKSRRYIYVVFMCHLALEKTLKAVLSGMQEGLPPYTHNLNKLVELAGISLSDEDQSFIDTINLQSVPTRYPEDFKRLAKEFSRTVVGDYLRNTKRIIRWLRKNTLQGK